MAAIDHHEAGGALRFRLGLAQPDALIRRHARDANIADEPAKSFVFELHRSAATA